MLYQTIYSSQASSPMSMDDLEEILVVARKANAARAVTGALIYVDGVFLQILEGEKDTLHALVKRIEQDPRHDSFTVFHEAEVPARVFSAWTMAYVSATPEQVATWAGLGATASLSVILEEIRQDPLKTSRVAEGILTLLSS